jgi:hypothetical protein
MPVAPAKFVPNEQKNTIIKVMSYEKKNPSGILENTFYGQGVAFHSVIELLTLIERMQDELSYPQKAEDSRSFSEGRETKIITDSASEFTSPPIASFRINVIFRQHASWQGSITWIDKNMESQFRSVLELLMLMDSVLA